MPIKAYQEEEKIKGNNLVINKREKKLGTHST